MMLLSHRQDEHPRLRLVVAPWASLYDLPVDAIVEEQDRHRILSLDPRPPRRDTEGYARLLRNAFEETPPPLGRVLPAGGRPLRLKAIVLDLNDGLHVEPRHLQTVADRLCLLIESQPIRRLGMPILGAVHGDIPPLVFAGIFAPRLRETGLETLFLLSGPNPPADLLRQLRQIFSSA